MMLKKSTFGHVPSNSNSYSEFLVEKAHHIRRQGARVFIKKPPLQIPSHLQCVELRVTGPFC